MGPTELSGSLKADTDKATPVPKSLPAAIDPSKEKYIPPHRRRALLEEEAKGQKTLSALQAKYSSLKMKLVAKEQSAAGHEVARPSASKAMVVGISDIGLPGTNSEQSVHAVINGTTISTKPLAPASSSRHNVFVGAEAIGPENSAKSNRSQFSAIRPRRDSSMPSKEPEGVVSDHPESIQTPLELTRNVPKALPPQIFLSKGSHACVRVGPKIAANRAGTKDIVPAGTPERSKIKAEARTPPYIPLTSSKAPTTSQSRPATLKMPSSTTKLLSHAMKPSTTAILKKSCPVPTIITPAPTRIAVVSYTATFQSPP